MNIGFIGLGIMGSRMAANLIKAGHPLTVHNRSADKAQSLLEQGATWAETPAEAASGAEVLITMLAHPQAVREMALGEGGFLAALPAGARWMDCSTVNPAFSREMAAHAQERGLRFVDAPVGGTKPQAAQAELIFMVGGAEEDVEQLNPLFEVMGQRVAHLGGTGAGTSLKMVVNMLLAGSMALFAEGVALGRALGLDEGMLLNVLIGGPVAAPFLAGKKPKMESGDYEPHFPLKWMHKDLHLATLSAYEAGATTMLGSLAREMFSQAIEGGLGEEDFSAFYAWLNRER
jgi:3-hydroxyisobutyrate dehydrogenase/glyoxylate/succinic semialdehyde reductase